MLALVTAGILAVGFGIQVRLAATIGLDREDLLNADPWYEWQGYLYLVAELGVLAVNAGVALAVARRFRWPAILGLLWACATTLAYFAYDASTLPLFSPWFGAQSRAFASGTVVDSLFEWALVMPYLACEMIGDVILAIPCWRYGDGARPLAWVYGFAAAAFAADLLSTIDVLPANPLITDFAIPIAQLARCLVAARWLGSLAVPRVLTRQNHEPRRRH